MITKVVEVRDRMTYIPAVATSLKYSYINQAANKILNNSGIWSHNDIVILTHLDRNKSSMDPYEWNDRTMKTAHDYIVKNWEFINNSDVIDVEYILGETSDKKENQ